MGSRITIASHKDVWREGERKRGRKGGMEIGAEKEREGGKAGEREGGRGRVSIINLYVHHCDYWMLTNG